MTQQLLCYRIFLWNILILPFCLKILLWMCFLIINDVPSSLWIGHNGKMTHGSVRQWVKGWFVDLFDWLFQKTHLIRVICSRIKIHGSCCEWNSDNRPNVPITCICKIFANFWIWFELLVHWNIWTFAAILYADSQLDVIF